MQLRNYDNWKATPADDWPECPGCAEESGVELEYQGELCVKHLAEELADAADYLMDQEREDPIENEWRED